MNEQHEVLVGAVSYLNTKPLVHELGQHYPRARLVFDLPSRLADRLASGELDVALIPSIELFRRPTFRVVSNACIACRGPVLSVRLFSRVPVERIRTLALDEASRTSAALARILLKQRYGLEPAVEQLPVGRDLSDCLTDAALLIGDRAIHAPPGDFGIVRDLGDEWCRWTQRPFVFAMWVARAGVDHAGLEEALAAARDRGLAALDQIAAMHGPVLGMSTAECLAYLRDNLYFFLGPQEKRGLEMFYRLSVRLGIVPSGYAETFFAAPTDRNPMVGGGEVPAQGASAAPPVLSSPKSEAQRT